MDLPESVAAIGKQLDGGNEIAVDPALLTGADVFAAERERLFLRPWVAVDHQSRVAAPGRYLRVDAATRSILLSRDADGRLHALRNVCIHAGYPVCEAEEGPSERMTCPYHGWEFAADGQLVEPDLSRRIDPARLRLARHPVAIQDGLVFVDPSLPANRDDETAAPVAPGLLPDWLAAGMVTARARCNTEWNWKLALQFVKSAPGLFCDGGGGEDFVEFGPLSWMLTRANEANLLRIIPRSASRTDIELIRIAPHGARLDNGLAALADGVRAAGDAETIAAAVKLDRTFFGWYWPLMSAG